MPASAAAGVPEGLDLAALEQVARDVAQDAGRMVLEDRPDRLGADSKSTRTDPVTEMDRRSQELILERLAALRPDDAVLGEEEGGAAGTSGLTWVVDPIDGTVNYLYGIPEFAVSVAVVVGDPAGRGWTPVAGAVHNPSRAETFHAHLGGGARRSSSTGTRALAVSQVADLGLSLVGTGFGYAPRRRVRQGRVLAELIGDVRDVRRQGSAALDLCAVACGRLDAYYETGLNPWDRAAGQLVAAEAGAVVGGTDEVPDEALTWAAAPGIAGELASRVRALTARHDVAADPSS